MLEPVQNPEDIIRNITPPTGILPRTPVSAAVRKVVRVELDTLIRMLPVALRGEDIEGVHKVRVTVRRLRTCLKFGRRYFQKPLVKSLLDDLKEVGQICGQVRDLDVLHLSLDSFTIRQNGENDPGPFVWEPTFGSEYRRSREKMHECAESTQFSTLLAHLDEFTHPTIGLKSEHELAELPGALSEFLFPMLVKQLGSILQFETSEEAPPPYAEFHRLRLLSKAQRYTLEFFLPVLQYRPAGLLLAHLILLQDHLGVLNDTVVAGRLIDQALSQDLSPATRQMVEAFKEYKANERASLTRSFVQTWAAFERIDPRATLSTAIQI